MLQRARNLYVVLLLSVLVIVQVRAQFEQVRSGFRPFSRAPTRVPYSWDMFAIRLSRCVVGWEPPLQVDGERVSAWHDRLPALEFDAVFNDPDSYEAAAVRGCAYRSRERTVVSLTCFDTDARVDERHFDCP
jgi:hypothetical protein